MTEVSVQKKTPSLQKLPNWFIQNDAANTEGTVVSCLLMSLLSLLQACQNCRMVATCS